MNTVKAIAAITNENEVIWVKGIQDSNTTVMAYIPYKYFSPKEQSEMDESKEEYPDMDAEIFIAECEVYHLTKQYDNFRITTIDIPFDIQDIVEGK